MEALDRRIVQLLAGDGRMSYTDLGRSTGLSTSAVHQRVRRLEERGVIRGYRAVVDYEEARIPVTALISITPFDPAAPDDVPDRLRHIPAIDSCFSVAGEESYVLKVRVSGPGELEDLLAAVRAAANVTTRTTVVLSTPWEDRSPLSSAPEATAELAPTAADVTSTDRVP
ncbi:Lrp/AsnC family transcriptional regulator [Luteipulveratus sp. YIM 133132]|uniref:Lrp/AsnC family transcriptional regulator n=1 Tax=Luteipulveratus flavus TaxID=3031728 RepID=UPI0023AFA858|nr:Lrp/AsnC family transcriptional regulator [Luteipulveratus sp. YIM 133132]MDE9367408.1 Lrp/AsnC family transcriptional regulator [Luteipulveratus sp. YIM 133132]